MPVLWAEDAVGLGGCGSALLWGIFLPALSDKLWLGCVLA